MATEIMHRIVENLKQDNARLEKELKEMTAKRDKWCEKAVAMMHINTYTMEVMQRKLGIRGGAIIYDYNNTTRLECPKCHGMSRINEVGEA